MIGTSISDLQNHPGINGSASFTDYVLTLVQGNTTQGFQSSRVIVSSDNKMSLFDIKKKVEDFMAANVKKVKGVF